MARTPLFRGAVHQNLYLVEGAREVHAVITVDSHTEPDGNTNHFSSARVRALWIGDLAQATVINDRVAVVTGKAELAEQVDDINLLAQLDQIYDQETGTFRLNKMSDQEEMRLDIESTKTTLLGRG